MYEIVIKCIVSEACFGIVKYFFLTEAYVFKLMWYFFLNWILEFVLISSVLVDYYFCKFFSDRKSISEKVV